MDKMLHRGIAKYVFYYKISSDTGYSWAGEITSSEKACAYTYTGLDEGATYNLYVIVYDNAGNYKSSTAVTQKN